MSRCGLFVGSLALSLTEVVSVRQKVDTSPGAEGSYVKSLKTGAQDLTNQVEKKITDGQAATQGKLDSLFKSLNDANSAANTAKKTASDFDKSWLGCAAAEWAMRQAVEVAEQGVMLVQNQKNEACQLQQDNKGFAFDATGKYKLDYACDFMIDGNCTAALSSWKQGELQKISTDAKAALAKDKANYKSLKASCYLKTQALVWAKAKFDSAQKVWNDKRAACKKLAAQRQASMCAFGTKAQAKCSAEAIYTTLVAATKKAQGDADSEVDRETEWMASRTTQCMITKSMQKGLNGAVATDDLKACQGEVDFAKDVGKLNTRQAEADTLSKTNPCTDAPITFFNGETWHVPAGAEPSSKSYTKAKFAPQFDPSTSRNFHFCAAPQ